MNPEVADFWKNRFVVSIYEIRETLVLADDFTGQYTKNLTLSDGSERTIQLTPVIRNGAAVIEYKDTGRRSFMGMIRVRTGAHTNGNLMLHVHDLGDLEAARAEWLSRHTSASPTLPIGSSLLSMPDFVPAGFIQGIEILNDNTTPMKFVVDALSAHLSLSAEESNQTMLAIHTRGGVLIPTLSFTEAERIAALITADAAKQGYPLMCRPVRI